MYWKAIGPKRMKFYSLESFSGEYFYKSPAESMQYNTLHVKYIDKFMNNLLIILPITLLSYAICFTAPVYAMFFQHIRCTPAGIHLPYLEKDSNLEFTLNMILQTIMTYFLLFGDLAIEIASCMINHAIILVPELIQFNLHEFQVELRANGINTKSIAQLRNGFLQIQDFNRFESCFFLGLLSVDRQFSMVFYFFTFFRYVLDLIDIYRDKLSICPIIWSFSIVLSIFSEFVVNFFFF